MNKPLIDTRLTTENLREVAASLLRQTGGKIFLFEGPMGAGKTTLIKEVCKVLGSTDHFSSPTYAIVNEYASPAGKIYHFDLYRVKHVEELLDLGIEEYLDSGNYCFIEWPALAENLVESDYVKVQLSMNGTQRSLKAWYIAD